jgi:hypothetical protein
MATTVSLYEDSSSSSSSSCSGSSSTLLKFSVRDDGEGCLTPAVTARLFQKFTQLQRSDGTSNLGGLRLGLFGVATKAHVLGEPYTVFMIWRLLCPCNYRVRSSERSVSQQQQHKHLSFACSNRQQQPLLSSSGALRCQCSATHCYCS